MARTYALLQGSGVVNTILADAEFIAATTGTGLFQDAVDITDVDPRPGIGWRYVDGAFVAPAQSTPRPEFDPSTMTVLAESDRPAYRSMPEGKPA